MPFLFDYLQRAVNRLPAEWREQHERMLAEEHIDRLAATIEHWLQNGVPAQQPLPHFPDVETTPPLREAFAPLEPVLTRWQKWATGQPDDAVEPEDLQAGLADAMLAAACPKMLILLGQRQTPASLTDARGIPPLYGTLMAAANSPYSEGDPLTVSARAWSKHAGRSDDNFWGEVRGSVWDKNARADELVRGILDNTTWWNVFGHFQHITVFEARRPSGHGVRWGHDGTSFIGFLEPFDTAERF